MSNFVPVNGYEGYYFINKQGEVLSAYYGIVLKHVLAAGYPRVVLYRPGGRGKGFHIHRLLAEHFIPNPLNLPQVNHIDGNTKNFQLSNLEWVTVSQNVQDGYNRGRVSVFPEWRKVNRTKICKNCTKEFQYKRKDTVFCGYSCSAKWRVINHPHTIARKRNDKGMFVC